MNGLDVFKIERHEDYEQILEDLTNEELVTMAEFVKDVIDSIENYPLEGESTLSSQVDDLIKTSEHCLRLLSLRLRLRPTSITGEYDEM